MVVILSSLLFTLIQACLPSFYHGCYLYLSVCTSLKSLTKWWKSCTLTVSIIHFWLNTHPQTNPLIAQVPSCLILKYRSEMRKLDFLLTSDWLQKLIQLSYWLKKIQLFQTTRPSSCLRPSVFLHFIVKIILKMNQFLKTDETMKILHREDDQSNVRLSCSQILYPWIPKRKYFSIS